MFMVNKDIRTFFTVPQAIDLTAEGIEDIWNCIQTK